MNRQAATSIGFTAVVLWGALALFTRWSAGIPPFQLLAMTFCIAALLMLGKTVAQGGSLLRLLRQPVRAWLLGVGGLFGYHLFYFIALNHAPPVEASLIAYLWPLLIVCFSVVLLKEPAGKMLWLGGLLTLAGCWALLWRPGAGFDLRYLGGYGAALLCALIWSLYSVLSRTLAAVPSDAVGLYCLGVSALAALCHGVLEETVWPLSGGQWLGVIGLGLGPVGIAFFTWDYGVKRGDIQLLGVLSYAAPLISTLLLIGFGEAEFTLTVLLGCGLIVGGALLASLGPALLGKPAPQA
ncbi:Permease of the drug/metabolite transporter (DMT) superfamily [Hahella chejuensis KCTC 2396]|uniref:Permease of the drug/metabolite transporter (DMT) superfamily n=1 Tax=Hahella chejuensis (strain KCTC 2396) TaxID=349521 RepID=Q2SKI6_HAHCH|nr:DMT family transporter [Hahella chejuensis]ABC28838.1 Permease of the drug/metabolite transporter (DMT) superfamily [Hahella chejuensis KCTC 2396]